jgi:hypothetical protein
MPPPSKQFHHPRDEIRELVPGRGWCAATDHILVEGHRVGWMHREEPVDQGDSGWRFFSGLESEAYLGVAEHVDGYDVNTVANYDPDIIPFLDAPVGSAFEREGTTTGDFIAVVPPEENPLFPIEAIAEGLNPRFPVVRGIQPLSDGWSIHLPVRFSRRHEEDRLVFWRPGLTLRLDLVRIEHKRSPDEKLAHMKKIVPPQAFGIEEVRGRGLARLAYRLKGDYRGDGEIRPVHGFYGFAFSENGYADLSVYADDENDVSTAREIWLSMRHSEPA